MLKLKPKLSPLHWSSAVFAPRRSSRPGYSKGMSYSEPVRLEFVNRTVVFGDWEELVDWIVKDESDSIGSSKKGSARVRVESESGATLTVPCDGCKTLAESEANGENAKSRNVQYMALNME